MTANDTALDWDAGTWTNVPSIVERVGAQLVVSATEGSDAWRHTSYGFVHESEHALLAPFALDTAMEVEFAGDFSTQFDQAGIFVRASDEHWIKAGVEYVDGGLQVGAVVTDGYSDWSMAPESAWIGCRILVRASWANDCLVIRAGRVGDAPRLVRVIPFRPRGPITAGPFLCAPNSATLRCTFHSWRTTPSDRALH
jgi:regulation of enolase protein 1 (concanavalin A-like superfamily)